MDFRRAKIIACKALPGYRLWIRFDDHLEGEVNLSHLVGKGVFDAWKSLEFFNAVSINPVTHTVSWGEDLDLDPYVLRQELLRKNT